MKLVIHRDITQKLLSILADVEVHGVKFVFLDAPAVMQPVEIIDNFLKLAPDVISGRASSNTIDGLVTQWIDSIFSNTGLNKKLVSEELRKRGYRAYAGGLTREYFLSLISALASRVPVILILSGFHSSSILHELDELMLEVQGYPVLVVAVGCESRNIPHGWIKVRVSHIGIDDVARLAAIETSRPQDPDFIKWLYNQTGGVVSRLYELIELLKEKGFMGQGQLVENFRNISVEPIIENQFDQLSALELQSGLLQLLSCVDVIDAGLITKLFGGKSLTELICNGIVTGCGSGYVRPAGEIVRHALSRYTSNRNCDAVIRRVLAEIEGASGREIGSLLINLKHPDERELELINAQSADIPSECGFSREDAAQIPAGTNPMSLVSQPIAPLFDEAEKLVKHAHLDDAKRIYRKIAGSSLASPFDKFFASLSLAKIAFATGDIAGTREELSQALRDASMSDDPAVASIARALEMKLKAFEGNLNDMFGVPWAALFGKVDETGILKDLSRHYTDVLFFKGMYDMRLKILERFESATDEEEGVTQAQIAETFIEMGNYESAAEKLAIAEQLIARIPLWEPVIRRLNAQLMIGKGQLERAESHIKEAVQLYDSMNAVVGLAKSIAIMGEILLRQGRLSEGLEAIDKALLLERDINYRLLLPYILERAIRGLDSRFPDGKIEQYIENYGEIVKELNAVPRVFWFSQTISRETSRKVLNTVHSRQGEHFVRIKALGPFKIVMPSGEVIVKIGSNKARQLLLTLALAEVGYINTSASSLALMLWPDMPPERQIHNIHWLLSHIRKSLGINIFMKAGNQYRLDPETVRTDVAQFIRLVEQGEIAEQAGHRLDAMRRYQEALKLIEGQPFVDVIFDAIEPITQYIQHRITSCYIKVSRYYLDSFKPQKAIDYACLGLIVEPYSVELREIMLNSYNAVGEKFLARRTKSMLDEF